MTNLAAGRLSTSSTDAVNGSQLDATNQAVIAADTATDALGTTTAAALGGSVTYDPVTGALSAPSYSLDGGTVTADNVGDALGNLDGRTTANANAITNLGDQLNDGTIGLVQQDAATRDITVAAGTNGTRVDFTGTVGARTLAGVAIGTVAAGSTEAINGSQLFAGNSSIASALGGGAAVNPDGTVSAPAYQVGGTTYNNVGDAFDGVNTALDDLSNGGGIKYFRANSTLADATASGTDALAAGPLATASAANATALGNGATAAQAGAVALGSSSVTAAAVATPSVSIAGTTYTFAGTTPASTVSIGAAGSERTLTNLAAGRLSTTSTDAVNGSQLNATNLAVSAADAATDALGAGTAAALGGGATYDPATGALGAPSYNVDGTPFNNAGDALTNLDGRTTANTTAITNLGDQLNNGTVGLVQQDQATRDITVAAATDGTRVDFTGTDGPRTLAGVAIGTVAAGSTEAINGSQLFAGNSSIASALGGGAAVNPDGTISSPTYTVNGTDYSNVGDALEHLSSGGLQPMYFHANSVLADSNAQGTDSIAIGPVANAENTDAIAVGRNAVAGTATTGAGAASFGATASATGNGSLALGQGATAAQDGAVALGAGAVTETAIGTSSVTLAGTTYTFAGATPVATVSIGSAGAERTLTNVAAGRLSASSTDAVNGSQLYATNQSVQSLASQVTAINGGGGVKYFRANSSGPDASASGTDSVAIGPRAVSSATGSVALGNGAQAAHGNSVALGSGSATTVGAQPSYTAAYVGASTSAGEVNIGNRTVTGVAAGAAPTDAVNVAQLGAGVQQAVDVSNAYTDAKVTQIINQGGGGQSLFKVNSTDTSMPSAAGTDSVAGGMGAAAAGRASTALGNDSKATGTQSTAMGNGAQATGDSSVAIGAGSVAARAASVSVGAAGAERQIIHVAAGTQDTDAVNVAQLKQSQAGTLQYGTSAGGAPDYSSLTLGGPGATTTTRVRNVSAGVAPNDAVNVQQLQAGLQDNLVQSRQYTDQRLQDVEGDMWTMRKDMRGGTASAMAMAGLPQSNVPGGNMLAVGVGGYQGEVGMAVGLSAMTDSGRYVLKANVSTNSRSDFGFAVGAGIQW